MKWKAVEDRTYRIGYKSLSDWERKACCGSWFRFRYSKYKSNGSLWESEFTDIWVSERVFWMKMENDYNVRERTKMCVYTSLSFFLFSCSTLRNSSHNQKILSKSIWAHLRKLKLRSSSHLISDGLICGGQLSHLRRQASRW